MIGRQKRKLSEDNTPSANVECNSESSSSSSNITLPPSLRNINNNLPMFQFSCSSSISLQETSTTVISILFRLNEDWFKTLVANWLDLQSIARLDTAFTNKLLRGYWLDCIGMHKLNLLSSAIILNLNHQSNLIASYFIL